MCNAFFITLFLIGKLRIFDGQGYLCKLLLSVLPTCIAIGIGITRIDDYMHHWTDVVAGLLLGMVIATVNYLMIYPWPFARSKTHIPLYESVRSRLATAERFESLDSELQDRMNVHNISFSVIVQRDFVERSRRALMCF